MVATNKKTGTSSKETTVAATNKKTALPSPEVAAELISEIAQEGTPDERPVGTKLAASEDEGQMIRSAMAEVTACATRLGVHEHTYLVNKNTILQQLQEAAQARDATVAAIAKKHKINIFDKSKGIWDVDLDAMTFTRTV